MSKYRFIIEADSVKDRDAIKKFLASAEQVYTLETVKKKKEPKSRADRLSRAEVFAEEAKCIVEELHDEMEQWRESIPENLQSGGSTLRLTIVATTWTNYNQTWNRRILILSSSRGCSND